MTESIKDIFDSIINALDQINEEDAFINWITLSCWMDQLESYYTFDANNIIYAKIYELHIMLISNESITEEFIIKIKKLYENILLLD